MPLAATPPPRHLPLHQGAELPAGGQLGLLSLFDGIRGASVALRSVGVVPACDYSSETDQTCQRLISEKYPAARQLGDVRKLTKDRLAGIVAAHPAVSLWLLVGGSPCQDLSQLRGAGRRGLDGAKSRLFYEFLRVAGILARLAPTAWLLENVASMSDGDRDAISRCMGVPPRTVDATPWCGCRRNRHYWTNISAAAAAPPQHPEQPRDIDAALDEGWTRPGNAPFRTFVASASRGSGFLRQTAGAVVRRADPEEQREPNADEREALLGFPRGYTRMDGVAERTRLRMVGNSFAVPVVAELLRPVARWAGAGAPLALAGVDPASTLARMDTIVDAGDGAAGDAGDGCGELSWD